MKQKPKAFLILILQPIPLHFRHLLSQNFNFQTKEFYIAFTLQILEHKNYHQAIHEFDIKPGENCTLAVQLSSFWHRCRGLFFVLIQV